MRFPIPIVVSMTDDQLRPWAEAKRVPGARDGKMRAKDAVDAMRAQVLAAVQREFGQDATVSISR